MMAGSVTFEDVWKMFQESVREADRRFQEAEQRSREFDRRFLETDRKL